MKRLASLFAALVMCLAAMAGCATNDGSASSGTNPTASETSFNLAQFTNPFIGQWQSDIPSAHTTLTFDYKPDGTFDYEMDGVAADEGGKGSGGYVVHDGMMLTWLDAEGAAAYTYDVVDNNTINVTEIEFGENGEQIPGNTSPFTRVEGSSVNTKDEPLKLSNDFLGTWQSEIPSANTTLTFTYKDDGTFDFEMPNVPADQGGEGTGYYIVFGDKQVSYLAHEGTAAYSFDVADANTINVTELVPDANGKLVPGNTAPFIRVH